MSAQASSTLVKTTRFFTVHGKVQQVMFRQTFIRGCIKRGLDGGASNDEQDNTLVKLTMHGDNGKIEEIVSFFESGKALNSWNAHVTRYKELKQGETNALPIEKHQVTTKNVDDFKWKKNVEMYL